MPQNPSLKDVIEAESKRLLQEFMPYLENEINKAGNSEHLTLCLSAQDCEPDYFPFEQASKSHVFELICALQAEAQINGLILPYAYENLAIISRGVERDEFALKVNSAREIIGKHSFGRTLVQQHITLSFGLSSYPFDSTFAYELLQKAWRALQEARDAGGNSVCSFWNLR